MIGYRMSDLASLAEEVAASLRTMLDDRDPDRDVPATAQLADRIIGACTPSPWDVKVWESRLDGLAEGVARFVPVEATSWSEAMHLLHVYLDASWVSVEEAEAHPAVDMNMTRGRGRGAQRRVPFELMKRVVRSSLAMRSPMFRAELWSTLRVWEVWRAALVVVPDLSLDTGEAIALLAAVESFSQGDMLAGDLNKSVAAWVKGNPKQARVIVDAWGQGADPAGALPSIVIARLVEWLAQVDWDKAWRDQAVTALAHPRHGEEGAKLATMLALHAWPEQFDTDVRIEALIDSTAQRPWALRSAALWSLQRLGRQDPRSALRAASQLLELPPPTQERDPAWLQEAHALTKLLQQIAWGAEGQAREIEEVARFADGVLDRIDPRFAREGWDTFVAELVRASPDQAEHLLGRWLEQHRHHPALEHGDIEEIVPLVVHRLRERPGPGLAAFLLRMAASRSDARWSVAIRLLANTRRANRAECEHDRLTDAEVVAVALRRLGTPHCQPSDVHDLARWARERPAVGEELVGYLVDFGLDLYPGATAESIRGWRAELGGGCSPHLERLERARRERDRRWEARASVPGALFATPTRQTWDRAQQRRMRDAWHAESRSARHPLLSMLRNVPIVRGEGMAFDGDGRDRGVVPFTRLEAGGELPARDGFDPVGARRKRLELLREADRRLAAAGDET